MIKQQLNKMIGIAWSWNLHIVSEDKIDLLFLPPVWVWEKPILSTISMTCEKNYKNKMYDKNVKKMLMDTHINKVCHLVHSS